ncbi:terminus macrodomain insulation protein YfbV [Gilliamella mensalis]|uniref:terminus macrodomain insulation protein YfbV n=1 Tax=Gilliamella mensalis TaxID=1908520 RepID=UPI0014288FA6|nr:terminus macrodomain insulation protein YfbV [Gilliamella mensalis]
MNLINTFKAGQRYMKLCPIDKQLAHSFPELKIINHIKTATKYLPPIVIGLVVWQYYMPASIAVTVITILFTLSMPLQGIFWLGKRALSPLPLNLIDWYNQLKSKLIAKKIIAENSEEDNNLTFEAFMKMINLAKLHLGNYFGQDDDISPYDKD